LDTEPRDFLRAYLAKEDMTLQDLAEQMKQFSEDCRLLDRAIPKIQAVASNLWVAVYQGHVIGADEDLQRLLWYLNIKGYPRTSLAIRFIYPVGLEPTLILQAAA